MSPKATKINFAVSCMSYIKNSKLPILTLKVILDHLRTLEVKKEEKSYKRSSRINLVGR